MSINDATRNDLTASEAARNRIEERLKSLYGMLDVLEGKLSAAMSPESPGDETQPTQLCVTRMQGWFIGFSDELRVLEKRLDSLIQRVEI